MDKQEIKKTLTLIDKFFEGETTLGEERHLYSLFTDKNIPEELEKYKELFTDFGALPVQQQRHKAVNRRLILQYISAIAASVVLAVISVVMYNNHNEQRLLAVQYGGSYVIENGKRIDDLRKIRPQIERILAEANQIDVNIDQSSVIRQVEQEVLNSIGDGDEQAKIELLLNE